MSVSFCDPWTCGGRNNQTITGPKYLEQKMHLSISEQQVSLYTKIINKKDSRLYHALVYCLCSLSFAGLVFYSLQSSVVCLVFSARSYLIMPPCWLCASSLALAWVATMCSLLGSWSSSRLKTEVPGQLLLHVSGPLEQYQRLYLLGYFAFHTRLQLLSNYKFVPDLLFLFSFMWNLPAKDVKV